MASTHASSEKRVSSPVGTTVSIADFLTNLPVRRQSAIREKVAATQLARIKRTLQAYAIARPHVRMSLKVLKSKSEKYNWSYAPKKFSPVELDVASFTQDAAAKIFGKKVTDDCQSIIWRCAESDALRESNLTTELNASPTDSNYTFEALLQKADCNLNFANLSNPHQYLSIDSRPVACTRGTLKQIVNLFKKSHRSAASENENNASTDPFLLLNIVCPRGSYDANIEPAKDDVLFEDSATILTLAKRFFFHVYGEPSAQTEHNASLPSKQVISKTDLLLATTRKSSSPFPEQSTGRKHHDFRPSALAGNSKDTHDRLAISDQSIPIHDISSNTGSLHVNHLQVGSRSMYNEEIDSSSDFEPLDDKVNPEMACEAHEEPLTLNDLSVSNPWAIAKFNACLRKPTNDSSTVTISNSPSHLPTPKPQRGDVSLSPGTASVGLSNGIEDSTRRLPSPGLSSSPPPFPYPIKARVKRPEGESSQARPCADPENVQLGGLDSWVVSSRSDHISEPPQETDETSTELHRRRTYGNDFVSARNLSRGTSLGEIPDASQRQPRKPGARKAKPNALDKPFISPVNDPERVWFDHGQRRHGRQHRQHQSSHTSAHPNEIDALNLREDQDDSRSTPSISTTKSIHPDLALTLDYEARKQQATQEYRANARRQALNKQKEALPTTNLEHYLQKSTPPSSSPHENRYLKAKAALQPPRSALGPSDPPPNKDQVFHPNDPRAILLHDLAQARTTNPTTDGVSRPKSRSRRARTALLPLKSVTEEDSVRELLLSLRTSSDAVAKAMEEVTKWDGYVADGVISEALVEVPESVARMWQEKVRDLIEERYGTAGDGEESRREVRIDILGTVAGLRSLV